MADTIVAALRTAEERRRVIVLTLDEDRELPGDCPVLVSVAGSADALAGQVVARLETLRTRTTDETRKRMGAEAGELRARKLLARYEQVVLDEIERKRKYAAYGLCIDDTKTHAITKKSTTVTRKVVTQKLKQSFQDELSSVDHKLVLTRAPGV